MGDHFRSRSIVGALGAIVGGLSLFRLSALLLNHELELVLERVIEFYDELLEPVRVVVGPVFGWAVELMGGELPTWWADAFVIWVVIGGITVRTGMAIDRKERRKVNAIESAVGGVALSLFGGVLLLYAVALWAKREVLILVAGSMEGVNFKEELKREEGYFSPWGVLIREFLATIGVALALFAFDAFA